jgi:glycosyltransferase involved in cell wall biosynthesis
MKKALFLGVTPLDFKEKEKFFHLKKKFEGLSSGIEPYVLTKGRPFYKKTWGTRFYLLPSAVFWILAPFVAFYLFLFKKIDVILAQSPLLEGFLGVFLKMFFGKELIVEVHGDWKEGPFLSKKRKFAFFQKRIVPLLAKLSLKRADKVRAISNFTKSEAEEISGKKPYFIFPTFTDIDIFLEEKDVSFENFVLFVGVLSPLKNVNGLIESFSKITKEFPDFKLVVVGEGKEREKLQFLAWNLGLEKKVEFKGKLSLNKTKDLMKKCYCLVLPSFSEGLGRVLMEAMALEKPVIGSKVGGIPDLIKDKENGFLIQPDNSSQLGEKLGILLGNRELAVKMGKKGKVFVQNNFSNQKYIESYISMINS